MLKNLILDMGGVMIDYTPAHFIDMLGIESAEDRTILNDRIFRIPEWNLMDWGAIDEPDLEKIVLPTIPEHLHKYVHELIFAWNTFAEPMPGMKELCAKCKAAGMKVFLLSNATHRLPTYFYDIPGSEYFDDIIVSADLNIIKPMPAIFTAALEKFGVKAEESIFVDDMPLNLSGAMLVGLHTFLFNRNADGLAEKLRSLGVNI